MVKTTSTVVPVSIRNQRATLAEANEFVRFILELKHPLLPVASCY